MESISILIYIYLLLTDLLQAPWDHLQEKSLSNTDFSWFTDGFFFLTQFYFFKYKFMYFNWRLITLHLVLVLPYINMNLPQVYTCSPT